MGKDRVPRVELVTRCPSCGADVPTAVLRLENAGPSERDSWTLAPTEHSLGRDDGCDVVLPPREGISRRHARLRWRGKAFEVADTGSRFGTSVNGRALEPGAWKTLRDGARLSLGGQEFVFNVPTSGGEGSVGLLSLLRKMTSLDPVVVVSRALELLREVSRIERALLVDAGSDPRLSPLLTSLADPELKVSRSTIEEALASRRTVTRSIDPFAATVPAHSISELGLRRIWVAPVAGPDGRPVAAVYLDSTGTGPDLEGPTSRLMEAVVEQIAIALRNASLHSQVVSLNENLEAKVRERTKALEQSQAQLVAQDRLATLGRLVAAIAHELNNPVGAIASLAESLDGLVGPITTLEAELISAFPESEDRALVHALLSRVLTLADAPADDTRARRQRAGALTVALSARGIRGAEDLSRRFARAGFAPSDLDPVGKLIEARGDAIARLVERVHTFGRATHTIGDSARNVARIVDGLKTYAHLDHASDEVADVHRSLEATLAVLESRVPAGVEIVTRYDPIEPFIHRPGELTQVWTNLVDNALRAMGDAGTLTVQTRNLGDRVEVSVEDTGVGVAEALRGRIFDLDVTSRGPGAGLGLGLPICKTIVEKNHGGSIVFESRPGRTRFAVTLLKNPIRPPESPA